MSFKKGVYTGQTKTILTKSGEELLVRYVKMVGGVLNDGGDGDSLPPPPFFSHGEGTYVYPNSFYKYQGQWNNGIKHGLLIITLLIK